MTRALRVAASPLVWLTLAYLAFELSFSARLLDAAATAAGIGDIQALEQVGRTLSGIALGLVAAGALLRSERPAGMGRAWVMGATALMVLGLAVDLRVGSERPALAAAGLACGAIAMVVVKRRGRWDADVGALVLALHLVAGVAAMYAFQAHLVDALVGRLGPEDRRAAAVLAEAAGRLSACQVRVDEIFLCDGASTPSGKAFTAIFPLLAIGLPDLDRRVMPALERLGARKFTTECNPGEERCIGTPEYFLNEVWLPLVVAVQGGAWADYQKQAVAGWARQERAWDDYAKKLSRRGFEPGTVPPAHWDRVRRELRKEGIQVADDWRPFDRQGFQAAVDAQAERKLRQAHKEKGLGSGSTPIQDFKVFFAQPGIQREIRRVLNVPEGKMAFRPVVDPAAVEAEIHGPLVREAVREYARVMGSAPEDFAEGGRHGEIGTQAAHRVVVPPVALLFSLLGGGGHLLKLLVLLTGAVTSNGAARALVSMAIVGALAFWPMARPNAVVGTQAYANLDAAAAGFVAGRVGEAGGRAAAGLLEWTVRAQDVFYPVNEAIRTRLLRGIEFGFGGPAKGPQEATPFIQ